MLLFKEEIIIKNNLIILFFKDNALNIFLNPKRHAFSFVLFWLMNCFASDAGGLVLGRAFGKTKFCTKISPNKTWEGVIGSIFAA